MVLGMRLCLRTRFIQILRVTQELELFIFFVLGRKYSSKSVCTFILFRMIYISNVLLTVQLFQSSLPPVHLFNPTSCFQSIPKSLSIKALALALVKQRCLSLSSKSSCPASAINVQISSTPGILKGRRREQPTRRTHNCPSKGNGSVLRASVLLRIQLNLHLRQSLLRV
jgi:hypothetical protein